MKTFFPASFQPIFRKIGSRTATNFSGKKYFFPACFVLFGRINGHLSTVIQPLEQIM
jgi:hypothetical protein